MLNPKYLEEIFGLWGIPEVDLMATPDNCQVPHFFSLFYRPQAIAQEALCQKWNFDWVYIFPPPLILRSLLKIMEEKFSAIVIAPFWSRRPWFFLLSPGDMPTNQTASGQGPTSSEWPVPPRSGSSRLDYVAFERDKLSSLILLESVMSTLLAARKLSTNTTYTRVWKYFLLSNGFCFKHPQWLICWGFLSLV